MLGVLPVGKRGLFLPRASLKRCPQVRLLPPALFPMVLMVHAGRGLESGAPGGRCDPPLARVSLAGRLRIRLLLSAAIFVGPVPLEPPARRGVLVDGDKLLLVRVNPPGYPQVHPPPSTLIPVALAVLLLAWVGSGVLVGPRGVLPSLVNWLGVR
ncbi:hypothetical protein [Actinokineospora sp. 24-640]